MTPQESYMRYVAEHNYDLFMKQGFATAGHNGPHGHEDTPARNTSHYLIIYTYLYKVTGEERYSKICRVLADFLCNMQGMSKSGAIQCMISDRFDHLNGLIGQGWVIEALIYYYELCNEKKYLDVARNIFYSQQYDWNLHLWNRIELDGSNIGIDPTYNHHVWFSACSYKLSDLCKDDNINKIIVDFMTYGAKRDLRVYSEDGILHHHVNLDAPMMKAIKRKALIKKILSPVRFLNPKKLDPKFMEYAYHVFDIYGFCILKEKYGHLPIFSSEPYKKAEACALTPDYLNRKLRSENSDVVYNAFGYSYNSLAFEYPYVAKACGIYQKEEFNRLYDIQKRLMWNDSDKMFSRNQPDIETWNARTYEIIRYIES